jgi:Hint domain
MKSFLLPWLAPLTLLACGGDSCFVAGTMVETPGGPTPIDALQVGDLVWSFSLERGETVARRVRAIIRSVASEVRTIRAGARVVAGVTPEHPFYDPARGEYRPVRDLRTGDALASLGAFGLAQCAIESVTATEIPTRAIEVWNLTIDGPEANYFVEGILVHNKEPAEVACPFGTVTIAPPTAPGDFDVTMEATPVGESVTIAIFQGRARLEAPFDLEKLDDRHYRVRLESTRPGEYEVMAAAHFLLNGQLCTEEQSRFFTLESKEPGDASTD